MITSVAERNGAHVGQKLLRHAVVDGDFAADSLHRAAQRENTSLCRYGCTVQNMPLEEPQDFRAALDGAR
jgi:hypothetical protein